MKKLKLIPVLALVFMLNVASMCSSDDDNSNSSQQDPTPVINTVNQGTWRITFFEDSGNNETNHFTGYNFTFASGNVLTATNGTNTYNGVWSVTNDDSNDDSPSNELDFNIAFSAPADFTDLTEDWTIITYTATKIQLVHVSGGNGGTDYVTFEKN
jgi:putative salt-induced outer membrane protein YdiY